LLAVGHVDGILIRRLSAKSRQMSNWS
jgi:hypothetical protein